MWKKWKESKLCNKLKQVRVNRAVYLSSIVILLALAVVLAITAATNRAKRTETEPPADTGNAVTDPNGDPGTQQPDQPTDVRPNPPVETIPELMLPTEGKLAKAHSTDVQVFSETMKDFRVHLGIDIATAADAEVFAAADGTVQKVWEDPMMGQCVAIRHSGDCVTVYKNLSKELAGGLTEGSTIKQGQLIGTVGDSAMMEIADEPHLHMEMTVKGLQVNPLDYFSAAVVATLSEDTAFETPTGSGK